MKDVDIRIEGCAGRITLLRPKALNALSSGMVSAINAVLPEWAADPKVKVLVIDADGDKAFCAGGDLAEIYDAGMRGDYAAARAFWRVEYWMNATLAEFPKPVISFLQGYTMGGGVGLGCHASHRVVCENSRIAMPEVGIGLVPDVGGSMLLAHAPGQLGAYLACTTRRMPPDDAIYAGFADHFVPRDVWPALMAEVVANGEPIAITEAAQAPPEGELQGLRPEIDQAFSARSLSDIKSALTQSGSPFSMETLASMTPNDPLAMAAAVLMQNSLRGDSSIRTALELEFRYTFRAPESGDFLEGIRALIIDKDRAPNWTYQDHPDLESAATAMLAPLGALAWTYELEGTEQ